MTIVEIEHLFTIFFSSYLIIQVLRICLVLVVFLYLKRKLSK